MVTRRTFESRGVTLRGSFRVGARACERSPLTDVVGRLTWGWAGPKLN